MGKWQAQNCGTGEETGSPLVPPKENAAPPSPGLYFTETRDEQIQVNNLCCFMPLSWW